MKSYQKLSEADLAVHYLQATGGADRMPDNAQALVDSVKAWLRKSHLDHRVDDAVDIAIEAFEIARQIRRQSAPIPPESEAAFRANVEGGTTADDAALRRMDELALAGQVAQMDLTEYGRNRSRFGLAKDLGAFLGGAE